MLTLSFVDNLKTGVIGVLLLLDSIVYWVLSLLFELFESLAGAEIISQNAYQQIAERFYVVIGVIMLFYIAYSLLKALVNPDEINKTTSKIVQNALISIVLLGLVPTFFNFAFTTQNAIIEDNVIGNLIFGEGTNNTIYKTGRYMSLTSLQAFLTIDDNTSASGNLTWEETKTLILESGDFSLIRDFSEVVNEGIDNAKYTPIISTICGIFLAYVALSFCLDLGVRVVKLAFYQIIAPIPVLMRIIPEKKSVFDSWVKKTIFTFLEVFVRIFIMYIIVYLASLLIGDDVNIIANDDLNLVAKVIVFMGIFAFAKQAPKLIGDITGINSGDIKLGIGGKLRDSFSVASRIPILGGLGNRALGAVTGGLGGLSTSLHNGAGFSGFGYGFFNGWKGKGLQFKKQRSALYNKVYEQEGAQGFFGGKPFVDQWSDDAKKAAQDRYHDVIGAQVEANPAWQAVYNAQEQELRSGRQENVNRITQQLNQLNENLEKAAEDFKNNQEKEYAALKALQETEQREFEIDKIKRLSDLKEKARQADAAGDSTTSAQLNKAIKLEEGRVYSNPELESRINAIRNQSFDASSYNSQIANLQSELEKATERANAPLSKDEIDELKTATRAKLLKEDDLSKKYKAMVKYTNKVENEKAAKKYRESSDGIAQAEMMAEALKKLTKEGGGSADLSKLGGDKKE